MNRHLRWTALAPRLSRVALVVWLMAAPLAARAEVFRYQPRGKAYVPKQSVPCNEPVSCTTPCPTCAGNDPNCACRKRCEPCQNCKPPCKQPCKPPCKQPEQPVYMQQPGMFVQPPASGTVRGPVNQYGVEGGEITFPALSLRLPSIRLPGFSHSRQNARMETDVALAPYVEMPAQPVAAAPANPVAAAPGPMMAAAPAMPMMAMPAPQMMMAPMQMPMMAPPAYAPPPVQAPPPPVAAPPQPPPDMPTPCPPSCDARGVPTAALNAEEKIRQLEVIEQQLQNRLEQLRRQLEQAEASQRPPVPTPDLGSRQLQQPLQTPGVHPVSRPLTPLPPQAAPQQTRLYDARPASFVSEPQLLPQAYAQPIREPQSSAARITGVRPR